MCGQFLSRVWLFATHQGPLSMRFSREETGAGCHFFLREILPTQGLNPHLLGLLHWQVDSLSLPHLGNPI